MAEGTGRASSRELRNFASIARGSASEVEYELVLAKDLGYIPEAQFDELVKKIKDIGRMLTGLIISLDRKIAAE